MPGGVRFHYQLRKQGCRFASRSLWILLRGNIDLLETDSRRLPELVRMAVQVGLKLLVTGCLLFGQVRVEELHFLTHAPADDEIILIEPQRQRLAVKDLLLDEVLGQAGQFLPARRAHPGALELPGQTLNLCLIDHDVIGTLGSVVADMAIEQEQPRAQHQEVEQGLAQEPEKEVAENHICHFKIRMAGIPA